jgi:hypothetical protein
LRIAVSGTHGSGKSSLVTSFLAVHRDYIHEPEPYEWLVDLYGDAFSDEPTVDDFYRQLEISSERLSSYGVDANVIAERCPLDFVAYLLALEDLGRTGHDAGLIASAMELATVSISHVDLLVVLPLSDRDGIVVPESEDLDLRDAMNERLLELIATHSGPPRIVEVSGTPRQRLQILEHAVSEIG